MDYRKTLTGFLPISTRPGDPFPPLELDHTSLPHLHYNESFQGLTPSRLETLNLKTSDPKRVTPVDSVTDSSFSSLIERSPQPVLLTIGSFEFPAFEQMLKAMKEVENDTVYMGKIRVYQAHPEKVPALISRLKIASMPTTLLFQPGHYPGEPSSEYLIGLRNTSELKSFLHRNQV
jgi:thioredoxin-like negative regulator of GroEL